MRYEHIDVGRIRVLTGELSHDAAASLRFIDDYITAWEHRRARVATAVDRLSIDDALAALLSLSTSSAMLGAEGLSQAARALHSEARQLGTIPARGADRLALIGDAVCIELRLVTAELRAA
jgi:hypothetical protein